MGQVFNDPNGAYSLEIPDHWEYEAVSHSIAFYNPEGAGALNISCLQSPKGISADPENVILNFVPKQVLESGNVHIVHKTSPNQRMSQAYTEYSIDGDAWRLWAIANSDRVVIASYNCKMASKGDENRIVDKIIKSIMV
ncbi:DUF3805 domain-containing protein [Singulisphaera sp. Ch08]|uniref:DUF3805 domain-containing protein n=1 Tax=Singulisphaera sp. Ch08 TaxID=3120278 RepID=A0AAU7CH48_9BACT